MKKVQDNFQNLYNFEIELTNP